MTFIITLVLSFLLAHSGAVLFEGDIEVDPSTDAIVNGLKTFDAVSSERRKWPGGKVPYVFASNFKLKGKNAVKDAIEEFKKYTCIRFVPRTTEKSYIEFVKGDGCSSVIGRVGGWQRISIGSGCESKVTVMHEMMHALGFWHEQSRLDRDKYIKINWQNVKYGKYNNNFRKYLQQEGDYYGEAYDLDSIMHYGNFYFSTNGEMTMEVIGDPYRMVGQRDGFSQTDVRQLNKVYKCKGYDHMKVPPMIGCVDRMSICAYYAKKGYCKTHKIGWLTSCCKSCKDMREKEKEKEKEKDKDKRPPCTDSNKSCKRWADTGYCKKMPTYMLKYCKKSCKVC